MTTVRGQFATQVWEQAWDYVYHQASDQVLGHSKNQVYIQVSNQVSSQVWGHSKNQVIAEVKK